MSDSETGEVCSPNISTRERRKRLAGGVIMFAISLAIMVALMAPFRKRLTPRPLEPHAQGIFWSLA